MEGWIKLHRKLTDWEWYNDLPTFKLFMHILLTVNYQPTRFKGTEIETGALNTTLDALADGSGLTKKQVRRALDNLENTGEIVKSRAYNSIIVKVQNYGVYQSTDEGAGHSNGIQKAHAGHSKGIQRAFTHTILKENKNTRIQENKNITSERAREAFLKNCPDVLITDEQADELLTRLSLDEFHTYMENLQEYITAGHKVHNPYQTILKWVERDRAV